MSKKTVACFTNLLSLKILNKEDKLFSNKSGSTFTNNNEHDWGNLVHKDNFEPTYILVDEKLCNAQP